MELKHLISARQFSNVKSLGEIFTLADGFKEKTNKINNSLAGKILATIFYEPSTRTRFSFESAMYKLGGSVISAESASNSSSFVKGETLEDSIKIISSYADAIILRHPREGAAKIASENSLVPVVNAGDGIGEHPTQALMDLYTIKRKFGKIDGLQIALVGDLLNGRTVHSLVYLFSLYKELRIYLVSPCQLKIPQEYKDFLKSKNIKFEELENLNEILGKIDVLYMTRIQKERFLSDEDYQKVKSAYIIDKMSLKKIKNSSIIMHPLPRVDEISREIDGDKRALYFQQAQNGLYVRMAILKTIFNN